MRSRSSSMRPVRAVALGLCLLMLSLGLSACEVVRPIVLVYGDSLTFESRDYITFLVGATHDVRVDAMGGTALCDYRDRIIRASNELRPKLVIAAFSGNSSTPCMGDSSSQEQITEKYYEDASTIARSLSSIGVPLALVTPPPILRLSTGTPPSVRQIPDDVRFETWAETGIDTERTPLSKQTPLGVVPSPPDEWEIGETPEGFHSETHVLDGVYRLVSSEWRAQGGAVGIIDGFTPFATAQGSWTKVQPCGPGEIGNPLCRNGLIDVRAADFGHFCPTTASYDGVVPKCSTYSPGALRWASQMAAYVRFIDGQTTGHLDAVTGGPESVSVEGWAIDPSLDVAGTHVHVYVGSAGTAIVADGDRPDVGRLFPVAGSTHGFSTTLRAAPGTQSVCAHAINHSGPGSNVWLGCRDVQVTSAAPFGFLDWVVGGTTAVTFGGWAADPETPTSPIEVRIQVGTSAPQTVTAGVERRDVGRVFPALGSFHGYSGTIAAPPGPHTVCATAIDVGVGGDTLLGCRAVTVGPS